MKNLNKPYSNLQVQNKYKKNQEHMLTEYNPKIKKVEKPRHRAIPTFTKLTYNNVLEPTTGFEPVTSSLPWMRSTY